MTWTYYLIGTCFCEVEISLPEAETSMSNAVYLAASPDTGCLALVDPRPLEA